MRKPVTGESYTLRCILTSLDLDDSPFLRFVEANQKVQVIQTSHVTREQLLSIEGFGQTLWRYERTTKESIPLFLYRTMLNPPIEQFVDIELDRTPWIQQHHPGTKWVTPKGFPRRQSE